MPDWKALLQATSSDIRRLDCVDRFSSIPVSVRESVSQHMYWVAIYAILVHRELGGPKELDAPIMIHAVTHDTPECVTGDVVRVFKYSSDEFYSQVEKAEAHVVSQIDRRVLNIIHEATKFLSEGNGDAWYVKSVVKAADFISLYQYMWRERMRGNREIEQFFSRMQADLRMMAERTAKETPESKYVHYVHPLAALYSEMSEENFSQKFLT